MLPKCWKRKKCNKITAHRRRKWFNGSQCSRKVIYRNDFSLSQFIANLAATVDSNHQQSAAKINKTPEFNLINKLHICHPFFHGFSFCTYAVSVGTGAPLATYFMCARRVVAYRMHVNHIFAQNALKVVYFICSGWLLYRLRSVGDVRLPDFMFAPK